MTLTVRRFVLFVLAAIAAGVVFVAAAPVAAQTGHDDHSLAEEHDTHAADAAHADEHAGDHGAAAGGAHGGGHGGQHKTPIDFNALNYIIAIIVFVAAIFILRAKAWPMIVKGLDEREEKILGEIEKAERARAEAETAQQQYAEELSKARGEAQRMIEEARAEASRAAADLKAQNEAEINEMRDSARKQIEAAQRAAVAEVYSEAGRVATLIAEKILQREVNEHDQQRLIDETLSEITQEYADQSA